MRDSYVCRIILFVCSGVLLANVLLFWSGAYQHVLAPSSTTGSFEWTIRDLQQRTVDPRHDVLVLGDSRIEAGLDVGSADAHGAGLHFVNGSVAGTTPRCWWYFVHDLDPSRDRYRAVVVPVDTYADDDSAIGSLDGNDRFMDLRYIVFHVHADDIVALAHSFTDPFAQIDVAFQLLLRGPVLRADIQDLLNDPRARVQALRETPALTAPWRMDSLRAMRVDFANDTIAWNGSALPEGEKNEVAQTILRVPQPSPAYARYRAMWLGRIVAYYRANGTPVVFVRIPARPAHRTWPAPPSGALVALAAAGAVLVPQDPYVALERTTLFFDHDHLNRSGAKLFSARLGGDVARAVLHPAAPQAAIPSATSTSAATATAPVPLHARSPAHATPLARATPRAHAGPAVVAAPQPPYAITDPLALASPAFAVFFCVVALGFYTLPRRLGLAMLLLASYCFYYTWNGAMVLAVMALTASDFVIALLMQAAQGPARRGWLTLGVAANLAFLGSFKYANFATQNVAALFGMQADPWLVSVFVPIGISFHTFQSISYLVDVHGGKVAASRDPLGYALYIGFFPQLLAGPIVRAANFFADLVPHAPPDGATILLGMREIALGLFKKIVLADQCARTADAYFGAWQTTPGSPAAWSALLAFTLQIYFDFSGYTGIAIGCARLLGFTFPENFRRPYLATSITEFWRRWHMSLSSWLRDYLYIPLGGSRHGELARLRNLMVTMLLGGLWHGANWTFVAWGAYHGALLSAERLFGIARTREDDARGVARVLRTLATFGLVALGWLLFRSPTFGDAAGIAQRLVAGGGGGWLLPGWVLALALVALACEAGVERGWHGFERSGPFALASGFGALALVTELLSNSGPAAPFVYFKF